jgi:hypothetical protein
MEQAQWWAQFGFAACIAAAALFQLPHRIDKALKETQEDLRLLTTAVHESQKALTRTVNLLTLVVAKQGGVEVKELRQDLDFLDGR